MHAWAETEDGGPPNPDELTSLQNQLGSTYPQLSDPAWVAFDHITEATMHPGSALLAPGMRVVKRGNITSADIEAVVPW